MITSKAVGLPEGAVNFSGRAHALPFRRFAHSHPIGLVLARLGVDTICCIKEKKIVYCTHYSSTKRLGTFDVITLT